MSFNKYLSLKSNVNGVIVNYYLSLEISKDETKIIAGFPKKKYCLMIEVTKNEFAELSSVSYEDHCFITNEELQYGMENLIKCCLSFTIGLFPKIKTVTFTDNSFITCKNNQRIYLADHSYIKSGQTWYEKYFGAIPQEEVVELIKLYKERIDKRLEDKIDLSKNEFNKKYNKNKKYQNLDNNIYTENMTIGEYLTKIMKTGKCEKYYEFYTSKIKTLLSRTEWKISKSKIIEYNVNYLIYVVPKCVNNSNIKKQVEKTIKNQFEGSGFRLSDIERVEDILVKPRKSKIK